MNIKATHSLFIAALVLATSVAFGQTAPAKQPESKAHVLTRVELDALLATPEKIVVLDVRRPDELSSIGGFPAYLSIQSSELEKSLAYLPKDRTFITVSNHASRAKRAADLLSSKGFKVAGAVGAQDYEAQGGTLVKVVKPERKPAADATAQAVAK